MSARDEPATAAHTSANTDASVSATAGEAFLRAFVARAGASKVLGYQAFVDLALFDPEVGYYMQSRPRIGYGTGTDFFTASTSGPVFGELVVAACRHRLGAADPTQYTFVEIGAESDGGILAEVKHPFGAVKTVRLGQTLDLSGRCVVFSNELFDAQPFRRFRYRNTHWVELGVALQGDRLHEVELAEVEGPMGPLILPDAAPPGYTLDAPISAVKLLGAIVRQPWSGLFVAFDYGKTWRELIEACPAGTARAYFRHTQTNDLLARPGQQDLTCHVCWEWLEGALAEARFTSVSVDTQESFFIRNAESYIAAAIAADAATLTARKQSLLQLLHGAHLGQKFQVLHGRREA